METTVRRELVRTLVLIGLGGLLVYLAWTRTQEAGEWRERVETLRIASAALQEDALEAHQEANDLRRVLSHAQANHEAQRAVYETFREETDERVGELRERIAVLREEVAEPLAQPDPEHLEPLERCRARLDLLAPRVERLTRLTELQAEQIEYLDARIAAADVEIGAGDALYRTCTTALEGGERALAAQLALAENAELRLEAYAGQVRALERKSRLDKVKWATAGFVAGYIVAR